MKLFQRILLVSMLMIVGASSASAQDGQGIESFERENVQAVSMLLSGYHELAPADAFTRVPQAPAIVEALARGPHTVVRDRALAAMGRYWPSGDVYLLFAGIIAADETPEATRHRVILLLAQTFGARAIPAVRPFLQSSDLQLQITAVQALGTIGTDESVEMIGEFAESATHPVLLEQIDKSSRVLR